MDEAPSTQPSLLVRLRDHGDERAWSEFTEIYGPLVYQLARRRGLQEADAQDLVQDVFRAVARAIERYDPDPARGSFRGWLSRIAGNLIINVLSAQRRHPRGSGDTEMQRLMEEQPEAAERRIGPVRGRIPPTAARLGRRASSRGVLRADLAGVLASGRAGSAGQGRGGVARDVGRHRLSVQEPGRHPHPPRDRAGGRRVKDHVFTEELAQWLPDRFAARNRV